MERAKYRFELNQVISGDNGEYVIVNREWRRDNTVKAIPRKWYTLICPNEHEYEIEESHLAGRIIKCPSCYHPKVAEVDSDFAAMFVNKEDTFIYTCMSHVKTDFYCANCGEICKDKSIHTIYQRGYVPCESCGDGRSYGERLFAAILDNQGLKYKYQKRVDFNGLRFFYDFELWDKKILFEINGCQHYGRGFEKMGGRTLEQERKNDYIKRNIAQKLGYKVIAIDARVSSLKHMRDSIENNKELGAIIEIQQINWSEVIKTSSTRKDLVILKMLKIGECPKNIAEKCHISERSVPQFKRRFIDDGLWDGVSEKDIQKDVENKKVIERIKKMQKKGMRSGDICKELNLNPSTFKKLLEIDVFPDPKKVKKWSIQEVTKVIEENDLPVELVSGFVDRRTKATWKCIQCETVFMATFLGLENGVKCPQCKGKKKVELYLLDNFPEEYEILSKYVASETKMRFKHLVCGKEFYRTPHSIKRSVIPCLECGERQRKRVDKKNRQL